MTSSKIRRVYQGVFNVLLKSLLISFIFALIDVVGVYFKIFERSKYSNDFSGYVSLSVAISDFMSIFLFLFVIIFIGFSLALFLPRFYVAMICPSCRYVKDVSSRDKDKAICPKCYTKMVPLKGFYDKKSVKEFKDKSREKTNKSS